MPQNENTANYDYNVVFPLADTDEAVVTVTIISDATTANTTIIRSDDEEFDIDQTADQKSGSATIGTGSQLRNKVYLATSLKCLAPQVQNFQVQYFINGKKIAEHTSAVADQQEPIVNLTIQFTKP